MLSKYLLSTSVNMRVSGCIVSAILCVILPLVLGAPTDESIKQQIATGLLRSDDFPYWSLNQAKLYDAYQRDPARRIWGPQLLFQKRFDSLSGATFGMQKKNFDEIDRNGFGSFVKRNFDEIDRTGLGYAKRNFDEIDRTGLGFHKKRNFDEIDRVGLGFNKRNFDEIDRTGFGSFVKRSV